MEILVFYWLEKFKCASPENFYGLNVILRAWHNVMRVSKPLSLISCTITVLSSAFPYLGPELSGNYGQKIIEQPRVPLENVVAIAKSKLYRSRWGARPARRLPFQYRTCLSKVSHPSVYVFVLETRSRRPSTKRMKK